MCKYVTSFIALLAVMCSATPCAVWAAAAPQVQAAQLAGLWQCETTQAGGVNLPEYERIEQIGNGLWLHGMSRPVAPATEPYYDYYVGYVGSHWSYIQIDPSRGIYFVGTSDGSALAPSEWKIIHPSGQSGYTFTLTNDSFAIDFPDLTQVCNRVAGIPAVALPPAAELNCKTWYAGWQLGQYATESLTVSKPQNGTPWWQGIARDAAGRVIYEYNVFTIGTRRISVLVNSLTESYAIATSYKLENLNDSVWMVAYPTVESGFAFKNVSYENDLPTAFTVIFKDGYQTCKQGR